MLSTLIKNEKKNTCIVVLVLIQMRSWNAIAMFFLYMIKKFCHCSMNYQTRPENEGFCLINFYATSKKMKQKHKCNSAMGNKYVSSLSFMFYFHRKLFKLLEKDCNRQSATLSPAVMQGRQDSHKFYNTTHSCLTWAGNTVFVFNRILAINDDLEGKPFVLG